MSFVWYEIRPLDTVFFGGGRPFGAGGTGFGQAIFPPLPFAFVGAVRAEIAKNLKVDFGVFKGDGHPILGSPNDLGSLEFRGPFLKKDNKVYLPYPLDFDLKLTEIGDGVVTSKDLVPSLLTVKEEKPKEKGKGPYLLEETDFKDYLLGKIDGIRPVSMSGLIKRERRPGIARERGKRIIKVGHFYIAEHLRIEGRFLFGLRSDNSRLLPEKGIFYLGGEKRTSAYQEIDIPKAFKECIEGQELKNSLKGKRRIKFVLLSPGVFKNGFLLDCFERKNNEIIFQFDSLPQAKVMAMALGKPRVVSGWDVANNRPRPALRAVPEGSVYWLKFEQTLNEDQVNTLFDDFYFKPLPSMQGGFSWQKAGFGLCALGIWDKEAEK